MQTLRQRLQRSWSLNVVKIIWKGGESVQTNNVITKMFDGIGSKSVSGVEGVNKFESKSKDVFSNLLQPQSNFLSERRKSVGKFDTPTYEYSADSYDRYQYKKNQIESGKPIEDKIIESAEEIETFAKDVIESVAEQLEVSEEDVVEAIEMLGVTVFDLLNPQVLAELTVKLTEVQDASMLLFDSRFQSLLCDITQIGKDFMNDLNLNTEQMQLLLSSMEILEHPEVVEAVDTANLTETMISNVQTETEQEVVSTGEQQLMENSQVYEPKVLIKDNSTEMVNVNSGDALSNPKENEQMSDTAGYSQENSSNENMMFEKNNSFEAAKKDSLQLDNENEGHIFSHFEQVSDAHSEMLKTPPVQSNNAYVSVDTVRIIEQLAERVRVTNFSEVSSIEMQLNPENLGKMYINISSKQGYVNAQISATNEAVKEALEAQIHELRETLQQAGVKVDAIEVTVASHEFEKNLEQGQSREEQEAERQEEMKEKNRRDLKLSDLENIEDSLDEEEALIARMMKENGNSLDYTV